MYLRPETPNSWRNRWQGQYKTIEMAADKITILYVDDEENNLFSFKAVFRMKYNVLTAISGDEAIKILEKKDVQIIITDQRMPEMTGVEFLEKVLEKYPDPMRILLTGYADMNAVIDAVNKGKIYHYLAKPWNEAELDQAIQDAYQKYLEKIEMQDMNEKLAVSNDQLEFLLRQKLLS
jgi:response regulator RpfG family c-di-GMP phosphodiesterase